MSQPDTKADTKIKHDSPNIVMIDVCQISPNPGAPPI